MPGIREHPALFARLAHWLRPEGRLPLSLGGSDAEGFTSDMQGATFFYSGDEPATAWAALVAAGFRLERWEVDDQSSRGHIAWPSATTVARLVAPSSIRLPHGDGDAMV